MGGGFILTNNSGWDVIKSAPETNQNQWQVRVRNGTGAPRFFMVRAMCIKP
jgi:hypothetical protein